MGRFFIVIDTKLCKVVKSALRGKIGPLMGTFLAVHTFGVGTSTAFWVCLRCLGVNVTQNGACTFFLRVIKERCYCGTICVSIWRAWVRSFFN